MPPSQQCQRAAGSADKREESIKKSGAEHIKHLLDTGAEQREESIRTRDLWMTHTKNGRGWVRESLPLTRTRLCLLLRRV